MIDFLKQNWTAIVATLALIQPWLFSLYKRAFKKGKVDIYPSGNIEIGFSEFGPTIGIQGTLLATNKDVFINNIQLKIRKLKNNEEHKFDWIAFKPPQINLGHNFPQTIEWPASFIVSTSQPNRYVIVFSDIETLNEIRVLIEGCIKETQTLRQKYHYLSWPKEGTVVGVGHEDVLREYRNSQAYQKAYDVINRFLYWEKGDCELTIIVNTDKPRKVFRSLYKFSLTDQDFESLRLNVISIIQNPFRLAFQQNPWIYYFAYTSYKV